MKKVLCMIALAAISFGSVYAYGPATTVKAKIQADTTKKEKPVKKDTTKKTPPGFNKR